MEQSPFWKADTQKILRPLRYRKLNFRVHNNWPLDTILCQLHPVHTLHLISLRSVSSICIYDSQVASSFQVSH